MSRILGVDPGPVRSAYVVLRGQEVLEHDILANDILLEALRWRRDWNDRMTLAIEKVAAQGMAVGQETMDTAFWVGRLTEAWALDERPFRLLYRRDIKLHLCGSCRAKDANVRQVLIDLFGGQAKAIGRKATPGPCYGIKADEWAALAAAVTLQQWQRDAVPTTKQEMKP